MSQQQRAAVDELMRHSGLDLGGGLREQRGLLEKIMTATPLADDVTTAPGRLGAVPVVDVDIAGVSREDVILYFHGGAYTMGSAGSAAALLSDLARRTGARGISVDYRLAPENPFPAALDDALAAYRGLLETDVPPSRIPMVGESAGGGLALATLVALARVEMPQPACAVVFSPWADLTLSGLSVSGKAAVDPSVTADGLRLRASDYTAGTDPADGLISPVFADLRGVPPLLIQAGSHEILLDDATRLAARAAAADVLVHLEVTPDVPHVFQSLAPMLDEADVSLTSAAAFIQAQLTSASGGVLAVA